MDSLRKTFEDIYDRYIEKIYRFVFLKVNSAEAAEDLCSETFSRYWQKLKLTKGREIKNPSAFLYRIAGNLVIDFYRKKALVQLISVENCPLTDPAMDLEKQALLTSDVNVIKTALSGLKEDYQNVIIWHYLEELSIDEIAKMLGKSEGAVRVLLHRALQSLKDELGA